MNPVRWLILGVIIAGCIILASPHFIDLDTVIGEKMHQAIDVLALNKTPADPEPVTLLAIGDVMLGRNVEFLMNTQGNQYPFQKIKEFLASADGVVANLEGPITSPHEQTPNGSFHFTFDPHVAQLLKQNSIGIVTLANNHTFDAGIAGYETTVAALDAAGVKHFGQPFDNSNHYILNTDIKGQHFIFIGFNFTNPSFDMTAALDTIKNIPKTKDDIVIAVVHGGTEYDLHSNNAQEEFYRNLIDDGATTVIAHHPHVVQEIEQYKGRIIFYSLGNFIFDQYFSKEVEQGLAVFMTITPKSITYNLTLIDGNHSQPRIASSNKQVPFLQNLARRSSSQITNQIEQGSITVER